MKVLGVDLGGTYIKAAVVNEEGDIFWKKTVETPVGYEAVAETIAQLTLEVTEKYEIAGVGIGTPGSIDHEKGVVRYSPNLKIGCSKVAIMLSQGPGPFTRTAVTKICSKK